MLGVPVIHGSHAGPFHGFFSPDLADVSYRSSYLGEAMVVDAHGAVLARRSAVEGAGVVVADIVLPQAPVPSLEIPEAFWTPREMPRPWMDSWKRWLESGADYYKTVTRPYLRTGQINEFVPAYLR
jgi:predicted amidohydrolase